MTANPSDTAELLSCPFCQSSFLIGAETPTSPVYCKDCHARAVDVERWNTRPAPSDHIADAGKMVGEELPTMASDKLAKELAQRITAWDEGRVASAHLMADLVARNRKAILAALRDGEN